MVRVEEEEEKDRHPAPVPTLREERNGNYSMTIWNSVIVVAATIQNAMSSGQENWISDENTSTRCMYVDNITGSAINKVFFTIYFFLVKLWFLNYVENVIAKKFLSKLVISEFA